MPKIIKENLLLSYFLLAYTISWIIWLPLYLPYFGIVTTIKIPYNHALGALGPILSAFIMTKLSEGNIKGLISKIFKWRVNWFWYLIAFSPLIVIYFLIFTDSILNNTSLTLSEIVTNKEFPEFSAIAFLIYNIFSFGIGEEAGWRGFALPGLQSKYNALISSISLTAGWALWHLPAFLYRPGYMDMGLPGIAGWLFSLFTGSIILTWIYNSTNGSIFICSIFHATIDVAFTSNLVNPQLINYLGAIVTITGIAIVIFYKPENLSKLPRQSIC